MNRVIVRSLIDFNLDHIFDCGQGFRWERNADGSYTGIAFGKVVRMRLLTIGEEVCADDVLNDVHFEGERESMKNTRCRANRGDYSTKMTTPNDSKVNIVHFAAPSTGKQTIGQSLLIENCTPEEFQEIWRSYLDLDRDYSAIKAKLSVNDPIMAEAITHGEGIRILKQDLWETIVSFIISQNNNIPRIKGCIEELSKLFGQPAGEFEGRVYYSVPGPEVLASLTEADLGPVRLGYRWKYLIETGKAVCQCGLPENEEQLVALCGVGPKVANCIKLFGLGWHDSFPIDVWVRRVMHQLYGIAESDTKAMATYAQEHFGDLGGFAQQYLFYYIREKNK